MLSFKYFPECQGKSQRKVFSICLFDRQDNWLSVTSSLPEMLELLRGFFFLQRLDFMNFSVVASLQKVLLKSTGIKGLA